MRCPRCGLENRPDITACARCGLPVPNAPGVPPVPGQRQQSTAPQDSPPDDEAQTMVIPRGGDGTPGAPFGPGGPGGGPGYASPAAGYAPPAGQPPYQTPGPPQPGPGAGQPSPPYAGAQPGAAWPAATGGHVTSRRDASGAVTSVLLTLGALLSLGYAVWAFTARRGIFADFADGATVSVDDARTSDRIDTVFVIVAGIVALLALVLWIVRRVGGRTSGGGLEIAGLAVAVLGALVALAGLYLSGGVTDDGSTIEQGERGVTATIVLGSGFTLLAAGLLIGLVTARPAPQATRRASGGW